MRASLIYAIGLFLLGSASAQEKKAPARPPAKVPNAAKPKAAPKQPKLPQSIPSKQIEQLQKMTPEEREKALANLPPDRRQQVEKQLDRLNQLTPQQRQQLDQRYETLQSLPPARQRAVRQELQNLRSMPVPERRARLASDEFKQQFSPQEQALIRGVFPGAAKSAK